MTFNRLYSCRNDNERDNRKIYFIDPVNDEGFYEEVRHVHAILVVPENSSS